MKSHLVFMTLSSLAAMKNHEEGGVQACKDFWSNVRDPSFKIVLRKSIILLELHFLLDEEKCVHKSIREVIYTYEPERVVTQTPLKERTYKTPQKKYLSKTVEQKRKEKKK